MMLRHVVFLIVLMTIVCPAAADSTADCVQPADQDRRIRGCSAIIEQQPSWWAYHARGNAYAGKKSYDRAIADYSRAAELDARNPWVYQRRGLAYEMKGEREKAVADYRLALTLDQAFQDAKDALSRLERDGGARKGAGAKALAQGGSVKAIFEKYNLLGVFAWDCSRPASRQNLHYVNRLLDANRVQREQMEGPATRTWFSIIDKAAETGPNEIRLGGLLTGMASGKYVTDLPGEGIWRVEPGRFVQWEATFAGQKVIAGGKHVANGQQMPWHNRCSAQ